MGMTTAGIKQWGVRESGMRTTRTMAQMAQTARAARTGKTSTTQQGGEIGEHDPGRPMTGDRDDDGPPTMTKGGWASKG